MNIFEDLYIIEDLFRVGNETNPRLDHVREQDIVMTYHEGKTFVLPNTGGISTFNTIHPRLRGTWWKCPAGASYPAELTIICDRDVAGIRHYTIQPAYPMELKIFQAALRKFAEKFNKV